MQVLLYQVKCWSLNDKLFVGWSRGILLMFPSFVRIDAFCAVNVPAFGLVREFICIMFVYHYDNDENYDLDHQY